VIKGDKQKCAYFGVNVILGLIIILGGKTCTLFHKL